VIRLDEAERGPRDRGVHQVAGRLDRHELLEHPNHLIRGRHGLGVAGLDDTVPDARGILVREDMVVAEQAQLPVLQHDEAPQSA
jgi:hypothetical protein